MALSLNGSTGISGVNGSAAAPAIKGGDDDSGIFFGTNEATITTGGTERLTIDSTGAATFSSTVKTSKIENANTTNGGVEIDSDGHVQAAGVQLPTAGSTGRRNMIVNGAMMIDQRNSGAAATPTGSYTYFLDRFAMWYGTGSGHTIQQVTDGPTGFKNSLKLTVGTGATPTGSDYGRITYSIEGYDAIPLNLGSSAAQAFTVSFYVKVSVAGTYGVQLYGTSAAIKYQASFNIASDEVNTWVRRSFTVPAGTFTTGTFNQDEGMALVLAFDVGEGPDRSVSAGYYPAASVQGALGLTGGTKILATSGATYQFTGLQLELGSKMTPFEHRSHGDELARCKRYFQGYDLGAYGSMGVVGRKSGSGYVEFDQVIPHGQMRATPTGSWTGTLNGCTLIRIDDGTAYVPTAVNVIGVNKNVYAIRATTTGTGGTGTVFTQSATGTSNKQSFELSAEL